MTGIKRRKSVHKRAKILIAEPDSLINPDAKEERVKTMQNTSESRQNTPMKGM